ncbi:MAG: hypothetical protein ACRDBY_04900 [Cetobacterium sp.]
MDKVLSETLYYIASMYVGALIFKQQKCSWKGFTFVQIITAILIVLTRYYIKF